MKIVLYALLVGLSFLAPVRRLDIAKLEPVEAIALSVEGNMLVLETDGEYTGKGATVAEALQKLRDNTPAVIYLDTARYLLVAEDAKAYQEEMAAQLKSSVKIGIYQGGEVKEEAKYLDAHGESGRKNGGHSQ